MEPDEVLDGYPHLEFFSHMSFHFLPGIKACALDDTTCPSLTDLFCGGIRKAAAGPHVSSVIEAALSFRSSSCFNDEVMVSRRSMFPMLFLIDSFRHIPS